MADGRGTHPNSLANLERGRKEHGINTENASARGKRSGEVRREYKTFRESAREALTPEVMEELTRAMIEKVRAGDVRAYEAIRDTVGEKPTDTLELSGGAALQVEITVVE